MDGSKSNAANGSFEVSTSNGSTSRIFRIRGSVLSSATAPSSSQVSLAASGRAADAGNVSPSISTGSRQPSTSANCLNQSALAQNSLPSTPSNTSGKLDMTIQNGARVPQPATGQAAADSAYDELQLLHDNPSNLKVRSKEHEIRTAPIITRDAYVAAGYREQTSQYGVLGRTISIFNGPTAYTPLDPRLYVNTNAPFSAVICGVQGSGKSHTVSVLLESMFIPNLPPIGALKKPLSGLVLHFGEGGPSARPCEAAWVATSENPGIKTPKVRVYVSKSSINTMRAVYAPLGNKVTVEPLLFDKNELDAQAFLSMMAVGSSENAPLYVQGMLAILRDLGENFTYDKFMNLLDERKTKFSSLQKSGLEQRMLLLTSLLDNDKYSKRASRFAAGQLTIVDLSDPFIDPASACGLFEIITRIFVRTEVGTGKVLLVDEAHKYLSSDTTVSGLTKSLLTLTREQRHLAMRVIISTQEPTVIPPVLLDLCTISILHRFSSPSWWKHLSQHVSADISADDAFDRVVKLETGEAIVLAPSGFGVFPDAPLGASRTSQTIPKLNQFGRRYVLMKTRRRITSDGGSSILVIE